MPKPLLWLMCTWKMLKCQWSLHWIWCRLSAANMPCTHQHQNRVHCIRACYFTFLNLLPHKTWHGIISTYTWIFKKFCCYFIALMLQFSYLFSFPTFVLILPRYCIKLSHRTYTYCRKYLCLLLPYICPILTLTLWDVYISCIEKHNWTWQWNCMCKFREKCQCKVEINSWKTHT